MRMRKIVEAKERPALEAAAKEFLAVKQAQMLSDETMHDYQAQLERFVCGSRNSTEYSLLEQDTLAFFAVIPDTSPARYNKPYQYISAFFNWMVRQEYIPKNPITANELKKRRDEGNIKPVSVSDLQRFMNCLDRIVFVESYFHLIVSDEDYAKQLWSLGNAYVSQKELGNADALISSIVIFQSRGSITATQGHIPETILRKYMTDWGLNAGTDFNTQDVEVGEILGDLPVDNKIKKRKYDFIVPFQSRRLGAKVFIQSQFYAGDSGSVSHKVVDQTDSTREVTLQKYPDAVFVEYLDGAGYFSSLNGDLRKMLAKPTTKDFIQIRTAPLKLRRALQGILFLTPLEIEHAVIRTSGKENEIYQLLRDEGYTDEEISRAFSLSVSEGNIVAYGEHKYAISPSRIEIVRKYCLLDVIANYGAPISIGNESGCLLVAGFETSWGLPQNEAIRIAQEVFPGLGELWSNVQDAFDDVQWLISRGFVITK